MSVTIGGLVFNGATGTPYPVIPEAALEAWTTAAEAYRFRGSPRKDGGEITAWLDCTHVNAQRRLAEAGGLIGYLVAVQYPHGTISYMPVATVSGEWQAMAGTTNGGVLVVRFTFDYDIQKYGGEVERSLVWCETSSSLAGPWTKQATWACFGQQDGLGTYLGDSEATAVGVLPDLSLIGKYVRLVRKAGYPTTKTVEWVGCITTAAASGRRDPVSGVGWGSRTVYQFAGIGAVLDRLVPVNWRGTDEGANGGIGGPPGTATVQAVMGHRDFNVDFAPDKGGSLVQVDAATTVGGSPMPTVYLHASGAPVTATLWTAEESLRTFLAITRLNHTSIPVVVSNAALLDYSDTWKVAGLSVLRFIAQVVSPTYGRTFRLDVVTGEAGVDGSGYVTVVPIDLDAAGSEADISTDASKEWSATISGEATLDTWWFDMGNREFVATVEFDDAIGLPGYKGWLAADETSWNGLTGEALNNNMLSAVWRRFVLRRLWNGTALGDSIPTKRQVIAGEETGVLTITADATPDGVYGGWRISRTIPTAVDMGGYENQVEPTTGYAGPMLWWYKGGTYTMLHEDLQVQAETDMNGITLGRGGTDATAIKTKFADSNTIRATLSFIHYLSWRVSRKSAAAQPRSDAPRTGITYERAANPRMDTAGTPILGLTNGTTPIFGVDAKRMDRGPDIAAQADKLKRWMLTNDGTAQWSSVNSDTLTPVPGSMVSQLKVVADPGPPPVVGTIVVGGIPVSQRRVSWDRFNPGVTWTASRIQPGLFGLVPAIAKQNSLPFSYEQKAKR